MVPLTRTPGRGTSPDQWSTGTESRSPDWEARQTLICFAFLWAAFTFFHQAKPTHWARTPIEALQTAAALAVLFRPSSLWAFLALVFLQLANLSWHLPDITNHAIFTLFVDLTIALAAVTEWVRRPSQPLDGVRLYRLFAPAVRVEVLILYAYVVLHKLNRDFLFPDVSCAVDHYQHLSRLVTGVVRVPLLPDGGAVRLALVWVTLIVEAAIPVLLWLPRWRVAGIGLGLMFHYVLGVNIYHDFSGMIFALYLLFAPPDFAASIGEWWAESDVRRRVERARAVLPQAVPVPLLVVLAAMAVLLATGNSWPVLHPIFLALWAVYGLTLIGVFAATVFSQRARFAAAEPAALRPHRALLPVPLLILLNGACPYLGLKTENSFAMFSNLRTEGGISNHPLFPAHTQPFGFQRDMVTVTESSDRYLQSLAERQTSVPFFTLREHLSRQRRRGRTGLAVTYVRGGVTHTVTNAEQHPELSANHPWWWRKFLTFREVDAGEHQRCKH